MTVSYTAQISRCGEDIEVQVEADVPKLGRLPSWEDEGPTILKVLYHGKDIHGLLNQSQFDRLEKLATECVNG